MQKNMPICLAIETSCDETSVSLTSERTIISNIISSQIDIHKKYGGVVPEIASRHHIENITHVTQEALEKANLGFNDIDFIATTYGPGLVGALLVGLSAAKGIAFSLDKPLVAVHHIAGHIAANYIANEWLEPPFICLVVSGGHTKIIHVKDYTEFEEIAGTRDDAAGEAFDKVARILGLGYPGGPKIDKLAKEGNKEVYSFPKTHFHDSLDFSFSGIKTSVLNTVNRMKQKQEEFKIEDIAASFQNAVVDILVNNTIKAAESLGIKKIALAGGVAANSGLRESFDLATKKRGLKLSYPPLILCTDNAAMVGCAGYYNYLKGNFASMDLNAVPWVELS